MSDSFMPQIDNVVLLMLENRSLDNVLGYLYSRNTPAYVYPEGSGVYQGLNTGQYSNPAYDWLNRVQHYKVEPIPTWVREKWNPYVIPYYNPTEEYTTHDGFGVTNQVFGNQNKVSKEPPYGTV